MWSSPGLGCARRIHLPGSIGNKGACGEKSISAANRRRRSASASAYMRFRLLSKPRGGTAGANRNTRLTTRLLLACCGSLLCGPFVIICAQLSRYCKKQQTQS